MRIFEYCWDIWEEHYRYRYCVLESSLVESDIFQVSLHMEWMKSNRGNQISKTCFSEKRDISQAGPHMGSMKSYMKEKICNAKFDHKTFNIVGQIWPRMLKFDEQVHIFTLLLRWQVIKNSGIQDVVTEIFFPHIDGICQLRWWLPLFPTLLTTQHFSPRQIDNDNDNADDTWITLREKRDVLANANIHTEVDTGHWLKIIGNFVWRAEHLHLWDGTIRSILHDRLQNIRKSGDRRQMMMIARRNERVTKLWNNILTGWQNDGRKTWQSDRHRDLKIWKTFKWHWAD